MTSTTVTPLDTLPEQLTRDPDDVADAIERVAKIAALGKWLSDAEKPTRDWLLAKATEVEDLTGASFSAKAAGLGRVVYTNPQPTPAIVDPDRFGRWYCQHVLDLDPDADPEEPKVTFGTGLLRRQEASVDAARLLAFLNDVAQCSTPEGVAVATEDFVDHVTVEERWYPDAGLLDNLIESKRVKVVDTLVVDLTTGEQVPGAGVKPAGRRVLQVTPDKGLKDRLRQELETALGAPRALTNSKEQQ